MEEYARSLKIKLYSKVVIRTFRGNWM